MTYSEGFPSTEDWEELQQEWDSPTVVRPPTTSPDFGKPIEPDWDSLLED